jgi:hypothetical protein
LTQLIKLSQEYIYSDKPITELNVREPLGEDLSKVDILDFVRALDFEKLSKINFKAVESDANQEVYINLTGEFINALKINYATRLALCVVAGKLTGTSAEFIEKLKLADNLKVLSVVGKLLAVGFFAAFRDFTVTSA